MTEFDASRYEALLPIGTGAMATVFVGRLRGAERKSRPVALKRAHRHLRDEPTLVASMKLEARLASRLRHTNVVRVLDVEDNEAELLLVLDYVEGCTLRTLTARLESTGETRPRETIRILLDIAAGLHAAHRATDEDGRLLGLVHRDVSPSNVLVGVDGIARLSDFGIAKVFLEGSDRTETGILKGKSAYMAPEYVMHQRANASSDLFSFAVVAWEALAGARLFKGSTEMETLERVVRAETRPLSSERPELAPLDGVLNRALSRLPSDRYSTVEQMAAELEAVARAHDLVASREQVSSLVVRIAGAELDERRRVLGETPLQSPKPRLRPRAASHSEDDPFQDEVETRVLSLPSALSNHAEPMTALSNHAEPMTALATRVPSSPSIDVLGEPAPLPVAHAKKRSGRGAERLTLIATFVVLALTLFAMWTRLRAAVPEGNSPAPPTNIPGSTSTGTPR